MKALIKVGYGCNENCTFCHTADIRHLEDTAPRVEAKIERAQALGYTMVVLSGGEPTIRPELLPWARKVAALGMDFGLVTNGLMLSYPEITRELLERCRLSYVYMSLHGGEAKVHRSVVRADTFGKAIAAIEQLAGKVPDLTVNCVVTGANVDHLVGLVDRLLPFDHLTLKFSMTQPKGAANRLFDQIVPKVEECAQKVGEAIRHGLAARRDDTLRFAHDGLPFCLLPGLEALYDDLKTHRFAAMIEADEDDYVPVDEVAKVHPDVCAPCSLRGACPGLYRGYQEVHGEAALVPRTGPRSNSYTFVPERDIARTPGAPCPVRADGVTPYDRGRTLFLQLKDRLRLFRTETRDFGDAELLFTKENLGQIYVDVSGKVAPDDFARDLKKLEPAAECEACDARSACTGAWKVAPGNAFARDEARLLAFLSTLRGSVLDLGCGDGRYLPALLADAEARDLSYTGVDPDAEAVAILQRRYGSPRASFRTARAEALPAELAARTFDHVLLLRSFNHLEDPDGVLDLASARLRPGGTLTVIDNVPFGLLRQAAHARRAEVAEVARFEHLRNESAADVARRMKGRPFRLDERRDVQPNTSDQWSLRYTRTENLP